MAASVAGEGRRGPERGDRIMPSIINDRAPRKRRVARTAAPRTTLCISRALPFLPSAESPEAGAGMCTIRATYAAPGSGRAERAPMRRDRADAAPAPLRCGRGRQVAERSFISGTPRHPAANHAPWNREPRPVGRQPVGGIRHRRGAEPDGIPRWRRRRDSNPRYAFGAYNGLANRRLQPLGHVSARAPAHIRGPRGAGNARAARLGSTARVRNDEGRPHRHCEAAPSPVIARPRSGRSNPGGRRREFRAGGVPCGRAVSGLLRPRSARARNDGGAAGPRVARARWRHRG